MLTRSILTATATATAIALVAGLGSASAGERFATIDGITALRLSTSELGRVVGANHKELSVHLPHGSMCAGAPCTGVLNNNRAEWHNGLLTAAAHNDVIHVH